LASVKEESGLAQVVPLIEPRIRLAAQGDRAAAEALLQEILPRVRNLVRYLVRGDSEVDDITQVALLSILRGLGGFRGHGKWTSWVDRITAREAIAYQKKTRRDRNRLQDLQREAEFLQPSQPPPDRFLKRRDLVRRLDGLPQAQREALVFHHVLGMSVGEVAEEMDVPFDTAKSRLRLGLKKLRSENSQGGDADE